MRLRTVAIGRCSSDLITSTRSRQGHSHARSMVQADAVARDAQEVVVMGDDAAQLVPLRDLSNAVTTVPGGPSPARPERRYYLRRVPPFDA